MTKLWGALPILLLATSGIAHAADYYVDPASGSPLNDGSAAAPWRSLQAVIDDEQLAPGDTVWLRSGDYGALTIRYRRNAAAVTIAAAPGAVPRLSHVALISSSGWTLRGLSVSPVYGRPRRYGAIVEIGGDAADIAVQDCTLSSAPDSSGWSAEQWKRTAINGVLAAGSRVVLRGNHIFNVYHGIHISADHALVERNLIDHFGGDGIRGLGDRSVYQFNTIKDCYKIDNNHDDGFQSWSVGPDGTPGAGEVVGGVLRGNRIIDYEDPDQPLRCTLEGIGMFDGMYVDWVIENNVIVVDHWHGITVMGGRNVRVVNNTVLDPNATSPGPPWISVTNHKDGRPSENSVVANNLMPRHAPSQDNVFALRRPGVTVSRNLTIVAPHALFVDPDANDLRLRPGSPAIDAGDPRYAPAADIDGVPRPQGARVDVGAYEAR